jgi:hypothetical protein
VITEAASAAFTPPTEIPGTAYYYVVVTNTNDSATGIKTASAASGTAAITITAPVDELPADELTGGYDELIDDYIDDYIDEYDDYIDGSIEELIDESIEE